MLKLYSSPGCGQCIFSKKYMDKAGIAYTELPGTEIPETVFAALNSQGMERRAPVMVDEETGNCWSQFRPDLIDRFGNPPVSAAG